MKIELFVQNLSTGDIFDVSDLVEGNITWETQRLGCGKLNFNLVKDNIISFGEGSIVRFRVDNQSVFYGYVFQKQRNKESILQITAYDQIRYLKNKDTYVFKGIKANEVLQKIAKDFDLKLGTIEDTVYVIPSMIEDNQSLQDIIYKALDYTIVSTKKMFVLYDNSGKLNLKNVENLKLDLIIDGESNLTDFDYTSTIDSDTANQIKLVQKNKTTGKRDVYIVKDSKNISLWGTLQYYETVDENFNAAQIKDRAMQSLNLYNRTYKSLSIPVLGDLRARAGFSVFINNLNLGDIILNQFMLIESASHSFANNEHTMDLVLRII